MSRVSSLDTGYVSGQLSVYPQERDDEDQLYRAANNAELPLRHSLPYNGRYIVVDDTSSFPDTGLLRVWGINGNSSELVYYGNKNTTTFSSLIRGFAGSTATDWSVTGTMVSASVMAEYHNAVKDAILNIQTNLGIEISPDSNSLNGILEAQETRFLAPKAQFRTYPIQGQPPLIVSFQNFSSGNAVRSLWDFGDGVTSVERNPSHTYSQEGIYTVTLTIITSTGALGTTTKSNYITVSQDSTIPFMYVQRLVASQDSGNNDYSEQTAIADSKTAQNFLFVDQTDGDIKQRYWILDDGTTETVVDPNNHTINHTYENPGTYNPSLIIIFEDDGYRTAYLSETITVI